MPGPRRRVKYGTGKKPGGCAIFLVVFTQTISFVALVNEPFQPYKNFHFDDRSKTLSVYNESTYETASKVIFDKKTKMRKPCSHFGGPIFEEKPIRNGLFFVLKIALLTSHGI